MKAYAIDGGVLRTGSANFSTSGENAQDNRLIVIRDAAAAKFEVHFERVWDAAEPMIEFGPAINALEPRQAKPRYGCFSFLAARSPAALASASHIALW